MKTMLDFYSKLELARKKRMKITSILTTHVSLCVALLTATGIVRASTPSPQTIIKCFFVYAPIFETGKNVGSKQLEKYGQLRVSWMGGYIQSHQNDESFKSISTKKLEEYKSHGVILEEKLTRAIKTKDQPLFNSVLDEATECDRQVGIKNQLQE
ncbi:hypothetical protein [Dickeya zeae]|uniref:hypothetical protein n=1 Tax=Dickeya zeae TaxID=204042 RepID=UPI00144312DE|nr:hypothetical protein [Dickeya zeae]